MVRDALLRSDVEGVEADVARTHVERQCSRTGRKAPQVGNPELHYESPPGPEVIRRVPKSLNPLGLLEQTTDAVEDHVDEREVPGDRGVREVAHRCGDRVGTRFPMELVEHLGRDVDATNLHPSFTQG